MCVIVHNARWTHDLPVTVQFARQLGLPVTTRMPRIVHELTISDDYHALYYRC
ncbi:MAG: hypothetical protein AAB325_17710 [Pseudomonadota bacterium]